MLRMVDKKIWMALYFALHTGLYAGIQTVDIGLRLSYLGATQKMINDKVVVDLGFLKPGVNYTGSNNIKIGTVTVKISQKMSSEDTSGCLLDHMEFNSVKIKNLERYSAKIATVDKIYIGGGNTITLTAKNIKGIVTHGDISQSKEEYFFVSSECITEGAMPGEALTALEYEFDLYADIDGNIPIGTVVGAFGENTNGVAVSIKDLISDQIKNSITNKSRRRK